MNDKLKVELSPESFVILQDYLIAHDSDIAWNVDDFGDLHDIFVEIFNKEPSKDLE
jgi:hypothetical protein